MMVVRGSGFRRIDDLDSDKALCCRMFLPPSIQQASEAPIVAQPWVLACRFAVHDAAAFSRADPSPIAHAGRLEDHLLLRCEGGIGPVTYAVTSDVTKPVT